MSYSRAALTVLTPGICPIQYSASARSASRSPGVIFVDSVSLVLRANFPFSHISRISRGFMAQRVPFPRMNLVSDPTTISPSRMTTGHSSSRFSSALAQRMSSGSPSVSRHDSVNRRVSST